MTLTQLNKTVLNFRFHKLVSKKDYPWPFETYFSFPCSATSSLVLLLHFCFMLCDLVPQHLVREPRCESFLLVCVIVQLLISPVMTADALADIEMLIERHNESFVRLYGTDAFRPKLHMAHTLSGKALWPFSSSLDHEIREQECSTQIQKILDFQKYSIISGRLFSDEDVQ